MSNSLPVILAALIAPVIIIMVLAKLQLPLCPNCGTRMEHVRGWKKITCPNCAHTVDT